MLKQQDCHRLRQNARTLEAVWSSPLAPAALWPLVLAHPLLYADLIRKSIKQSESYSFGPEPGLTQVSSAWPSGKAQSWLELPASWQAPAWLRLERLIPGKAWLAWHYQLQATDSGSELRLRLEYLLLPSEQPALQTGFKRLGEMIAAQLEALSQTGNLRYPELGPPEWLSLTEAAGTLGPAARRELSLSGRIDPMHLANQTACESQDALDWLEQARFAGLLETHWENLEPDQHEGQPADWQGKWQSPLWGSTQPGGLSQRGLRYGLPQMSLRPLPWSPLSNLSARLLLWPGQSKDYALTESQRWALADGSSSGLIRLSPGADSPALDTGAPQARLKTSGPLQLRNSTNRLQLLCFKPSSGPDLPSHAGNLLASPTALSQLLSVWPMSQAQTFEAIMLRLSADLAPALGTGLSLRGGASLSASLFCFASLPAALDGAARLLGILREALASGLLPEPLPVLALASGPGILRRVPQGLSLEGELADRLTQLLGMGLGSDLLLTGRLLHDESCQHWIAGSRWQISEAEGQDAFQLRPPR